MQEVITPPPYSFVDLLNGYVLDVAFCYRQDESMLVLIIYGCKPNKDPPTMEVLHLFRDIYIIGTLYK